MTKEQKIAAILAEHSAYRIYTCSAVPELAARERKARTKGILIGAIGTLIVIGSFMITSWANDQPAIIPSLQDIDSVLNDTLIVPNHIDRESVNPSIQREYDSLVKGRDSL